MTSTSLQAVTPIPTLTERDIPARPSPEGFLARRPIVGLGLFLLGGLIFAILAVSVRANGPLLAWGALVYTSLELYHQRRSTRLSKAASQALAEPALPWA